jgi:MOSC domain-containing protein YiiM
MVGGNSEHFARVASRFRASNPSNRTDLGLRIVSLNVGLPRDVIWHGRTVTTGIYKSPVEGPVALRKLNLDGDRQADLTVHGGDYKAVYCYPIEHYAYWRGKLPGRDLPPGSFGENFTTEGLLEDDVHIGDQYTVGSLQATRSDGSGPAEVIVTQPRLPCYKLGVRFEADDMVKRFLASRRTGFYLAVTREGQVATGDAIKLLSPNPNAVSIAAFVELYVTKTWTPDDITQIRGLFELPSLPNDWKHHFQARLEDAQPAATV